MKRSTFDTVLSFLLGFAWAMLIIGGLMVFKITSAFGLPFAFLMTMIFVFWVLFCILVLEAINLYKERNEQQQDQIRLLRKIAGLLEKQPD